jgi:uncharacterized protein YjbJ (UPF0337 family)
MMTQQELHGNWNSIAGKVKAEYGSVTDDELQQVEGNLDQLLGLIQRKTGQSREQIEAFIDAASTEPETVGERVSEYAEMSSRAVREGYQQVAEKARHGYQQSAEVVAHRPMESLVAAFSVGLLTGLAIGLTIAADRNPQPSWQQRWRG